MNNIIINYKLFVYPSQDIEYIYEIFITVTLVSRRKRTNRCALVPWIEEEDHEEIESVVVLLFTILY